MQFRRLHLKAPSVMRERLIQLGLQRHRWRNTNLNWTMSMNSRVVFLVLLIPTLVACVMGTFDRVTMLRPEAEHVTAITREPSGCRTIAEITGRGRSETDRESAMESARSDLRNQAHDRGATHVVIRHTDQGRSIVGTWTTSTTVEMIGTAVTCPPVETQQKAKQ